MIKTKFFTYVFVFFVVSILSAGSELEEGKKAYNQGNFFKAAKLFQVSCDNENQEGCQKLGDLYLEGKGIERNHTKAHDIFDTACEKGSSESCHKLGDMINNGSYGSGTASQYYKKGCDGGYLKSCKELGDLIKYSTYLSEEYAAPEIYLKKACIGKIDGSCESLYYLGSDYEKGSDKIQQDYSKAIEIYDTACSGNNANACNQLSHMYEESKGVEIDLIKSFNFMKKACQLGDGWSCLSLGSMYTDGKGTPKNYKEAMKIYLPYCNGNSASACISMGGAYEYGQGVKKDINLARKYYWKACNLVEDFSAPIGCARYKITFLKK